MNTKRTKKTIALLGGVCMAIAATWLFWNVCAPAEVPPDETLYAPSQINALAVRVVALRMCQQRQMRGIFDYGDVPDDIRRQAKAEVDAMSGRQKEDLLRATFSVQLTASNKAARSIRIGRLFAAVMMALGATAIVWHTMMKRKEVI